MKPDPICPGTSAAAPPASDAPWETLDEGELTPTNLRALFDNRIPAIRLPAMASPQECDRFCHALLTEPFVAYENHLPPVARVGPAQFEAVLKGSHHYFSQVEAANEVLQRLCAAAGFNPLERLFLTLAAQGGISLRVPNEPAERSPYFVGMIRHIMVRNRLHLDFGPSELPDWTIGRVQAQLAWNLYLSASPESGTCVVYNKPWSPDDERFKVPDAPGYFEELVQGRQLKRMQPRVGDAILFNCRNFHEIEHTSGTRISISAFIGKLTDDDFIAWS